MSSPPNFKLHKSPRFSVNQLADYIVAGNARQREAVIRSAKFPRTTAVVPYTSTRRIVTEFLPRHADGFGKLDDELKRLALRQRREPEGWMRDELQRNIDALEAFKQAFRTRRLARYSFSTGPVDLTMTLAGVRISTRLDCRLIETQEDETAVGGGVVLFVANADASRKLIEERSKIVAAMVHWNLQHVGGNIEPVERLCLSFDIFGSAVTKAPKAIERLRANVESSCREAASAWAAVAPPPSYDGPNWD